VSQYLTCVVYDRLDNCILMMSFKTIYQPPDRFKSCRAFD